MPVLRCSKRKIRVEKKPSASRAPPPAGDEHGTGTLSLNYHLSLSLLCALPARSSARSGSTDTALKAMANACMMCDMIRPKRRGPPHMTFSDEDDRAALHNHIYKTSNADPWRYHSALRRPPLPRGHRRHSAPRSLRARPRMPNPTHAHGNKTQDVRLMESVLPHVLPPEGSVADHPADSTQVSCPTTSVRTSPGAPLLHTNCGMSSAAGSAAGSTSAPASTAPPSPPSAAAPTAGAADSYGASAPAGSNCRSSTNRVKGYGRQGSGVQGEQGSGLRVSRDPGIRVSRDPGIRG